MQTECLRAAKLLEEVGVDAEVIDPIWLSPLDVDCICRSVERTGRLLVVDTAWTSCGASAEIVSLVAERLSGIRDLKLERLGFAPTTCPTSPTLENAFYPNAHKIAQKAFDLIEGRDLNFLLGDSQTETDQSFRGPF
jgi:pyruvate/2-oxoglutarate/acetoin dehydrogenase E1 component